MMLSACLLISTAIAAPLSSASDEQAGISPYALSFEGATSFLSYDQYTGLGFALGSAEDVDAAPDMHPLQEDSKYTLQEVTYGWSNPQVLAVMLSAPYWNELDYGADMTAPGSTSFTLTSGVETSSSGGYNVALGLAFAAEAKAEVMGNGVTIGAEIQASLQKAREVQASKASEKELSFKAGAGEDHVALAVFPVASYRYSYKASNGATEYMHVNVQLKPTNTTTTLANYNRVVREYNASQTSEETMLPVIDMRYIYPHYTAGDPSTMFASTSDIPSCLLFENGKLIATDANEARADDQLVGDVYVSDSTYSVTAGNADTGAEFALTASSSNGTTQSLGVSLNASIFGAISEGVDVGVVEVSGSQRLTLSGELGLSISHAKLNTQSVSYAVGVIDLPKSAQTGTTGTGNAKSDYAFNARLAIWSPRTVGSHVRYAPTIIGALAEFPDTNAMPLYLPDDLHASKATADSITLAWSNPDFGAAPYNKRKPTVYEIMTVVQVNGTTSYTAVGTVSADSESYTIEGLQADTEYTYLLRAKHDDGRISAYGPAVQVGTDTVGGPLITTQPEDLVTALGEQPIMSVEAQPTANGTLSYKWYKLVKERYGTTWQLIGETDTNSFNLAYFAKDGCISASNRYDLDDTVYHCVVIETGGGTATAVTSETITLTVKNVYYVRTHSDLREIALSIQKGLRKAATSHYILTDDIVCPNGEPWDVPIGSEANPFSGSFDGQGHTISGLNWNIVGQGCSGLFGYIRGATVTGLHLTDVDIYAKRAYTGAVCGRAVDSVISECSVTGRVQGYSDMGGGYAVAGICGRTEGSTVVERCVNHASVEGQISYLGGIVGQQGGGTVENCANHGTLKVYCPVDSDYMTMRAYAAGIVGYGSGRVANCYTTYTLSWSSVYPQHEELCNNIAAENSYYLGNSSGSESKTAAQFASGEVAYLLNRGVTDGTQAWYQNLDNGKTPDAWPQLTDNGRNTVYALEDGGYNNSGRQMAEGGKPTTTTTALDTVTTTTTTTAGATTAATTVPATTVTTPTSPQTGESGDAAIVIVMMLLGGAATVLFAALKSKKETT